MTDYLEKLDRLITLHRWEMDEQIGIDESQKLEQKQLHKELRKVLRKV